MAGSMTMAEATADEAGVPDEHLLAARCVRGEVGAFGELVAVHQQRIAALAYRLLGWRGDVEDVVQDVFLAALCKLPEFRGECRMSTWLYRITVNRCRRRPRVLGRLRPRALGPHAAASPTQDAQQRETHAEVREAVRRLRPREREVVVLRYLEELPIDQIGQVLNLSRNAVEVRLSRARQRLYDRLRGLLED